MEEKLNSYFATLRNFSRIFMHHVVDDGRSVMPDLKLSQIKAIAAFQDESCFSMKELANNIGVKLTTMTMMVDNLIRDGLLCHGIKQADSVFSMKCSSVFFEEKQTNHYGEMYYERSHRIYNGAFCYATGTRSNCSCFKTSP